MYDKIMDEKNPVYRKVLFYMKTSTPNKRYLLPALALTAFSLFSLSGCDLLQPTSESQGSTSHLVDHSESVSTVAESEVFESITQTEIEALQEQLVATPEVHSSDWNLILVNQANQLNEDLNFEPYTASSGETLDARIAQDFEEMIAAGEAEGLPFIFVSGYRSFAYQEQIYANVYSGHFNNGRSEAEAKESTEAFIAIPGTSEHMTGLAADITDPALYHLENGLVTEFESTASAQWLYENAADYGFVLRYPRGKEGIIDVSYEAWHFRYVGRENAQYMVENQLVLEEYVALLQKNEAIREQISELSE